MQNECHGWTFIREYSYPQKSKHVFEMMVENPIYNSIRALQPDIEVGIEEIPA